MTKSNTETFFPKLKCGCLNDHFNLLGGGTVHSFKFLEYLKKYYDVDVYIHKTPKTKEWMKNYLHLDVDGLTFHKYAPGIGKKYSYMFLNISHWKAEETDAFKKYMLVFFPQFYFPIKNDYEFLANSEYTKKNIIERWKRPAKKIHVIYPPIMTSQFKPGRKTNSIIHVSRITPPRPEADKGHKQMIEAFKKIHDERYEWTLNLVGQVENESYYKELLAMINGYPIFIHRSISFKKLQELYGKAKIYWHLTGITMPAEAGAQEHFGMTIVEAMASGCVPISLNTGGTKEIIENVKNGYLINDLKQLKQKTILLMKDRVLLKSMSQKAIERSRDFDEEVTAKRFYSLVSKTDKASIVILCWNNSKYTKDCVNQLYKVTPPGFELILVDNASTDNTKVVLQQLKKDHKDIKLIFNKSNLGFAKGNNIGAKQATRPYICYLNNDTLPQWGWLERMINILEVKHKAAVVGARLYFPYNEKRGWIVQHAGITFTSGEPKHIGGRQEDSRVRKVGIEEVEAVTGACMLIKKQFARFDERFKRGYYEDNDLCLRTREKGYKVYIDHKAKLIHYEGASQTIAKKENNVRFAEINIKNKRLFHSLWDKKIKKLPKISSVLDTTRSNHTKNIEIGGGEIPLYPNYAQVDLREIPKAKYRNDARVLPFASNSISNICACYMLQCLTQKEAAVALIEWLRVLRPGGKLEIHVPDLNKIMRMFISTENEDLLNEIYGNQKHELDYYKYSWTFRTIDILLSKVNFVRVSYTKNPKNKPYSLSVIAYKPK